MNLPVECADRSVDEARVPRAIVVEPGEKFWGQFGDQIEDLRFDVIHLREEAKGGQIGPFRALLKFLEGFGNLRAVVGSRFVRTHGDRAAVDVHAVANIGQMQPERIRLFDERAKLGALGVTQEIVPKCAQTPRFDRSPGQVVCEAPDGVEVDDDSVEQPGLLLQAVIKLACANEASAHVAHGLREIANRLIDSGVFKIAKYLVPVTDGIDVVQAKPEWRLQVAISEGRGGLVDDLIEIEVDEIVWHGGALGAVPIARCQEKNALEVHRTAPVHAPNSGVWTAAERRVAAA